MIFHGLRVRVEYIRGWGYRGAGARGWGNLGKTFITRTPSFLFGFTRQHHNILQILCNNKSINKGRCDNVILERKTKLLLVGAFARKKTLNVFSVLFTQMFLILPWVVGWGWGRGGNHKSFLILPGILQFWY